MTTVGAPIKLPQLPVPIKDFIPYFSHQSNASATEILEPFKAYESELRKVYAQEPHHETLKDGHTNIVPVFDGHETKLKIRARELANESPLEKERYIMPLDLLERKSDGSPAVVNSLKEFQHNFNLFSESSLGELDWSNIVAAGSAVTTALLPVPEQWSGSKKTLRQYYHEVLAPASDVDLFIYGLNEQQAIEKIKQIETKIKDSILHETTTVRTKNAITIVSQHCAAYNGEQVFASPRALVSFMTQINTIDLTRRSPSYENRLSKYSHRGFEVYWPLLDRSRIDPSIYERSFNRTLGLARLLVLEKLPSSADRDTYNDQRREERGRPRANRAGRDQHRLWGNLKDQEEDDVAEWVKAVEHSNYQTMVIPYGKRFNAAKINKLLYTKDLLLNAEWNRPKDREVNLHRHPCFFGDSSDIIEDCCGFCPVPVTEIETEVAAEESKIYISGKLKFIVEDPGRQEIGSFNPITTDDWCDMAFVGNTQMLCQAIVDGDAAYVRQWCTQDGNDVNRRDYVGRTPLHLAVMSSTTEIVQLLVDNGARLIARLSDGRTALHIAASSGSLDFVNILMQRSNWNRELDDQKQLKANITVDHSIDSGPDATHGSACGSEPSEVDEFGSDSNEVESVTVGSFVKVKAEKETGNDIPEDNLDGPDVLEVDVLAWDFSTSPLHLAILNGHVDMIRLLVEDHGADVLLPVKPTSSTVVTFGITNNAILSLVLALSLPVTKAQEVIKLLLELGATTSQADINEYTAFHYLVSEDQSPLLDILLKEDGPAANSVMNHVSQTGHTPLTIALKKGLETMSIKLLELGANPIISFSDFMKVQLSRNDHAKHWSPEQSQTQYRQLVAQPIVLAGEKCLPTAIQQLILRGADVQAMDQTAYGNIQNLTSMHWKRGNALLDIVNTKISELKAYDGEAFHLAQPEKLAEKQYYVEGLQVGSYQYWRATNRFDAFKESNEKAHRKYNNELESAKGKKSGVDEKKKAIISIILQLEKIRAGMISAGAKTFEEMYPEVHKATRDNNNFRHHHQPTVPDLDDRKREGYLRLFEAVWKDDMATAKALTLALWKSPDGFENLPLPVAVRDDDGFSPFSIAALRGHYQLARAIIEIALAQFEPTENKDAKRWTITSENDDNSSDCDSEDSTDLNIYSQIVDRAFTIEDVTAISALVKSHVDPLTIIEWPCMSRWFSENTTLNVDEYSYTAQISLLNHAVQVDDMKLLRFLLEVGGKERARTATGEKIHSISIDVFDAAIKLGRVAMLAEIIKDTGVGIPLDELVQRSGATVLETPRYYQGLSIAGKKNLRWAQRGHDRYSPDISINTRAPLLTAAYSGSIDSVQWFLSDAPLQKYMEFAANNRTNTNVRTLEQVGFEKTIMKWLKTSDELALHCAILWRSSPKELEKQEDLVKFLLRVMPDSLEHRSSQGYTPLHLAALCQKPRIVKILLSAGADPSAVDLTGRNLIHHLVAPITLENANRSRGFGANPLTNVEVLRDTLCLFDRSIVKNLLLKTCSSTDMKFSGLTPLGLWVAKNEHRGNGHVYHTKTDIIEVFAEYSEGEEYDMINGAGDSLIHQVVKQSSPSLISYFVKKFPSLLHRENATGRSPLEVASDIYLHDRLANPPKISEQSHYWYRNEDPSILSKSPRDFLPSTECDEDEKKNPKRVYEICVEGARQNPAKRRLITLFEANEVAKRLTSRKFKVIPFNEVKNRGNEVINDELSQWI